MEDSQGDLTTSRIAADIVLAYIGTRSVEPERLPVLLREVIAALESGRGGAQAIQEPLAEAEAPPATGAADPQPANRDLVLADGAATPWMPVEDTVTADYIICLEDGRKFQTLRRHLGSKYGMTPEMYRLKWGLPDDYPMVCASYASRRSAIARDIGLGRGAAPRRDAA